MTKSKEEKRVNLRKRLKKGNILVDYHNESLLLTKRVGHSFREVAVTLGELLSNPFVQWGLEDILKEKDD